MALTIQMQNAAEAARELAETRRLSEELIALMKEARREAAMPAGAPPAPALSSGGVTVPPPPVEAASTAIVSAGEIGAPPQAAPAIALPPVAPAAPSTVANADTASNSVAPTSLAFFGTGTSLGQLPYSASAAPAPATAATADLAPSLPSVAQPAEKPLKKAPRAVKAVKPKIETRRPPVAARVSDKAAEPDRAPASAASVASVGPVNQTAKPKSSSAESPTAFRELASIPPAVGSTASPARTTIARGWMKLERGMSPKEVRRLLGAPLATERLMSGEFWFYAERSIFGRGWVAFSDGTVIEWLSP